MENERAIECGQIYYLRYDDSVGAEQAVGRPVLVVSNPDEIRKKQTVIVLLLTNQKHDLNKSVKILINGRPTYILCDQIRTIDKSRLDTYMTTISNADLKRVRGAMTYVLSLTGVVNGVTVEAEVKSPEVEKANEIKAIVEAELYQALYTKAMADLIEARWKLDELQLKYKMKLAEETCFGGAHKVCGEVPTTKKETMVDVEALKQKMTTPNSEMRIDDPPIVKEVEVVEPVGRDEEIPEKLKKSSGGNKKKKKTLTLEEIDEILIKNGFSIINNGKAKLAKGAKPVNVNTATKDDFKSLGMGNHVVGALIKHRTEKGDFESFEDLLLVKYFGPAVARTYGSYLEI